MRRTHLLALALCLAACKGGGGGGGGDDDPGDPDAQGGGDDGGGGGGGDGLFSDDLPWDRDVFGLTPSGDSDTIIGELDDSGGWGTGDFRMDFSIVVLEAGSATPRKTWIPKDDAWAGDPDLAEYWSPDGDHVPFPYPDGGALEGEDGYDCTNDGDCHLIVIERDERKLYEMWR